MNLDAERARLDRVQVVLAARHADYLAYQAEADARREAAHGSSRDSSETMGFGAAKATGDVW